MTAKYRLTITLPAPLIEDLSMDPGEVARLLAPGMMDVVEQWVIDRRLRSAARDNSILDILDPDD